MNLQVTKNKVLETIEKFPETTKVFETLWPGLLQDDKPTIKIGQIMLRKKYPKNVYCLIKLNGKVRLLNITNNSFWDSQKELYVNSLKDKTNYEQLTINEFKSLVGENRSEDFTFQDKFFSKNLVDVCNRYKLIKGNVSEMLEDAIKDFYSTVPTLMIKRLEDILETNKYDFLRNG